jgi:hypothetical protein
MKKLNLVGRTILSMGLGLAVIAGPLGCSSMKGKSSDEIATTGPTIVDVKTDPGTFELNRNLKPKTATDIYANVKDFNSNVSTVKIRFTYVPLELNMKPMAGSTWHATLTPKELKRLAVLGQTIRYQADVIATSKDGKVTVSKSPVEIAVKAPSAQDMTG